MYRFKLQIILSVSGIILTTYDVVYTSALWQQIKISLVIILYAAASKN